MEHDKHSRILQFKGIIEFSVYGSLDKGGNTLAHRLGRYKRKNGYSNKILASLIGCDESSITRILKDLNVFNKTIDSVEHFLKEVSD